MAERFSKLRWLLTITIIVAMVVVSLLPQPYKEWFSTAGVLHMTVHIVAFFVLGMLGMTALKPRSKQLIFAVALVLIGTLIELGQGRLYDNRVEVEDVAADVAGVALAMLVTVRRVTAQ